jgi:hypothetical protein
MNKQLRTKDEEEEKEEEKKGIRASRSPSLPLLSRATP